MYVCMYAYINIYTRRWRFVSPDHQKKKSGDTKIVLLRVGVTPLVGSNPLVLRIPPCTPHPPSYLASPLVPRIPPRTSHPPSYPASPLVPWI